MARGLTPQHLQQIAALEAACLAVDGGRLKLEYPSLRNRALEAANDFLAWSGPNGSGELIGFCGIYQHRSDEAEICGMTHPAFRRRGIFTRLLDAAAAELGRRGQRRVLLIVDRSCAAGVAFAVARGAVLDSSEHRMTQREPPEPDGSGERVRLRPASSEADVAFVRDCTAGAFGLGPDAVAGTNWEETAVRTLVIEGDGEPVGVIRLEREASASSAGIYGFAVRPERQGRGYGRGALSAVTRALRDEGISSIHLEVLVDNPGALHLYESCGFVSTGIEDYYLLPV